MPCRQIASDLIEIYIDVNLNGYVLTLRADFITGESGVTAILGTIDSAYFGGVRLSDYEIDCLFEFLTVKLQYDWISVDDEAGTLTLDFTATFKENALLVALLSSSKHIVTVCKSRLILDGGYVQITFNLF